jgi:hypothetical protein
MNRVVVLIAVAILVAACERHAAEPQPARAAPTDQLQQLVASNAKVVGYVYSAEQPSIVASFSNGWLQWRAEGANYPVAQAQAEIFTEPDRTCIGFEQKNPSLASHGPAQYLVCEAVQPITVSNSLPRSQDFWLKPKMLFLQYQPPRGTGYTQYYYASRSTQ